MYSLYFQNPLFLELTSSPKSDAKDSNAALCSSDNFLGTSTFTVNSRLPFKRLLIFCIPLSKLFS